MPGRATRPLFDLLREGNSSAAATRPIHVETRSAVEASTARDGGRGSVGRAAGTAPRVTVTLNTLYVLAAAVILSWVLVWVAGSKIGQRRAEDQLRRDLGGLPPTLPPTSDPMSEAGSEAGSTQGAGAAERPRVGPPITGAGGGGSGPIITSKGRVEVDPRQPGLNYLAIATVPVAEAERAVAFLREKGGVEAVGVPVDPPGSRSNNPRYKLVVLVGVPKDQITEKAAAMAELRRTVEQLGPQWQKAYPGGSNFRSSVWEKHQP